MIRMLKIFFISGTIPDLMQGACLPCPAGNSCADPRYGPIPCAPGTYSLGGNYTSCTVCPEGYSCPDPGQLPLACSLGELMNDQGDRAIVHTPKAYWL